MSVITQVPFYPTDWLSGTRGMTAAQMGVYITLIAMMYEHAGPIRCDDMPKLARLCGTSASALKGLLDGLISDGKITVENGFISNRRALLEIEKVMAKSEVAREKSKARWQKKPEKSMPDECSSIAPAMLAISHKPIEDISSLRSDNAREEKPIEKPKREPSRFDEFWRAYPKRDGTNPKEPARQKFDQAVKRGESAEAIISAAKAYAEQQKRLGNLNTPYVKQAATWLNQKSWADDYSGSGGDAGKGCGTVLSRLPESQIENYVQRYFSGQMQWNSAQLGPAPDRPGTLVPVEIINRARASPKQVA